MTPGHPGYMASAGLKGVISDRTYPGGSLSTAKRLYVTGVMETVVKRFLTLFTRETSSNRFACLRITTVWPEDLRYVFGDPPKYTIKSRVEDT